MEKFKYHYHGPVCVFGRCVSNNWDSDTWAVSSAKAKSNFAYQFSKLLNRVPQSKIEFPGQITMVN